MSIGEGAPLASALTPKQEHTRMSQEVVSQLAPTGVLRAGINLSNFLLVTGRSAAGETLGSLGNASGAGTALA